MSITESYIKQTLDGIRLNIDEVGTNGKYDDSTLLKNVLGPSLQDVMHRIHNSSQLPVVNVYDFTIAANVNHVTLPPCIGQVWRVVLLDDADEETFEVYSRHDLSIGGFNVRFEGNSLHIHKELTGAQDIRIYYTHTGKVGWHYGGSAAHGIAATTSGASKFTCATTPTIGAVDRRLNAYGGQLLRTFPSTGVIEERVIDKSIYTLGSWVLNLRDAFNVVDGSVAYEIVPPGPPAMWEAVTYSACIRLGTIRSMTQKQMAYFHDLYKGARKTLVEQVGNFDGRQGKKFDGNTKDSNEYVVWL